MPHLKFHGKVLKQYHGIDKDTVVVAGPGDVIHVSEEKADRLLKDFPVEFELHHVSGRGESKSSEEQYVEEIDTEEVPRVETKDIKPGKDKMIGKAKKTKRKSKWQ